MDSFFRNIYARLALKCWAGSKIIGKHGRIRVKRSYSYYDSILITCRWSLREVMPDGSLSKPYYSDEDRVSSYYVTKHIKKVDVHVLPKMIQKFAEKIGEEL